MKLWVALQAAFGAIRLYLNFACLEFLPLGDALTIIFTEPLFTVILSFILLRISVGIVKIILCFGLLSGMMLSVQPPFIFGSPDSLDGLDGLSSLNLTNDNDIDDINVTSLAVMEEQDIHRELYYNGVLMAMGCAVCGSLCNILINKCDQVRSTMLVFQAGLAGIVTSVLGCWLEANTNRIVTNMEALTAVEWVVLSMISMLGILAYFSMTASLKMITPTSVSVLRALEIVLAYLCQILILAQMPNLLCVIGASLVIISVVGIAIEERYKSRLPRNMTENPTASRPTTTLQVGPTFVINPPEEEVTETTTSTNFGYRRI